jgi:hypothetical protein
MNLVTEKKPLLYQFIPFERAWMRMHTKHIFLKTNQDVVST